MALVALDGLGMEGDSFRWRHGKLNVARYSSPSPQRSYPLTNLTCSEPQPQINQAYGLIPASTVQYSPSGLQY